MYTKTAQNIQTALVGINHKPLKPFRIMRLSRPTANKQLDLEAVNCANVCTLTKYAHVPIFMQIINVLDRHYRCQRIESNALASAYVT